MKAGDTYSESQQARTTNLWMTMLGWCLARVLMNFPPAKKSAENPLDIFDRLRLRTAFAEIFQASGFETEECWRAAARIRILLMAELEKQISTGKSSIGISESLWKNPDVEWLTQLHPFNGRTYFLMENYEQLIRWLALPHLVKLAQAKPIDSKTSRAIESDIQDAMAAAADAGYELGTLLKQSSSKPTAPGNSSKKSAAARKKTVKKCPESISGHTRSSGSSQQEDIQDRR